MGRTRRHLCALLACGLSLSSQTARAAAPVEQGPACDNHGANHLLNGHPFFPLRSVLFPFATTYLSLGLGAGAGSMTSEGFDLTETAVKNGVTLAAAAEDFELGVRVTDWVGLRLRLAATALTATDIEDLLVGDNLKLTYSVESGAVVKLFATRHWRLAAGLSFGYFSGWFARLGDALSASVDSALDPSSSRLDELAAQLANGQITLAEFRSAMSEVVGDSFASGSSALLLAQSGWAIAPTVTGAWAPWPFLGVQASLGYSWISRNVEELRQGALSGETTSAVEFGLALSFDAAPLHLPLLVPFAYQLTRTFPTEEGATASFHQIETGIYYSGRKTLVFGAVFLANRAGSNGALYTGVLRLGYFF